jgi:hypothetical protein
VTSNGIHTKRITKHIYIEVEAMSIDEFTTILWFRSTKDQLFNIYTVHCRITQLMVDHFNQKSWNKRNYQTQTVYTGSLLFYKFFPKSTCSNDINFQILPFPTHMFVARTKILSW